jgi:hypothetical protein
MRRRLFDAIGADCDAASRPLTDASFAVMLGMASELALSGLDCILEGNFRCSEHESLLPQLPTARTAQVLCRVDDAIASQHDKISSAVFE